VVRSRLVTRLDRVLARAATARPAADSARWHAFEHRVRVGSGPATFAEARAEVLAWRMQRAAGIVVHPADAVPVAGATIVLALPIGPTWITAPCRVADVVDEPGRAGFTYAALPGHPEEGVETFLVETDTDGTVWFTVAASSRPAAWYARLGAPVARLIQRRTTRTYLAAIGGNDR